MTAYDVRPATVEDAPRLGLVHAVVWQEAYAGIMPAEFLATLTPHDAARRWAEGLAVLDPRRSVLVGTADGEVVGFVSAGPSRDDPPDPAAELWAVNVLAAHHGTGLATRMVETALEPYRDQAVSLWVVRENARARAFYTRLGFVPDGQESAHEPTGTPEVRLVRPARGQRRGTEAR